MLKAFISTLSRNRQRHSVIVPIARNLSHTSASALHSPPLTVSAQTHIAHCALWVIQESIYRQLKQAASL